MTIQLPPDQTGKLVETAVPDVVSSQHRGVYAIGSHVTTAMMPVTSSAGALVAMSSGTVTLSSNPTIISASSGVVQVLTSGTLITAMSSGTVTLSSNPTIISASSGVVQVLTSGTLVVQTSGTATVVNASSGFVQVYVTGSSGSAAPATSSGGLLVTQSATIRSLSSGTVTLSSNPTIISASSGVVQVLTSGTLIAALTSGTVTLSSNPTVISASSGTVQVLTSGTLVVQTSGTTTIVSASSGLVQVLTSGTLVVQTSGTTVVQMTTGVTGGITSTYRLLTSVHPVKTAAGILYGFAAYTTAPLGAWLQFYNATTGNVTVGTSMTMSLPIQGWSTLGGYSTAAVPTFGQFGSPPYLYWFGPQGIAFGTAISVCPAVSASGTALTSAAANNVTGVSFSCFYV